jgi:protein farnesyltransferase/geranylgeranyltransferase type-1 subunit alpha
MHARSYTHPRFARVQWFHRRKCLQALNKDLDEEIEYTNEVGGENPKNYQIWFHRRACLDQLGGGVEHARKELQYVGRVIDDDSKNYHAWSHRQYIITTYSLWEGEVNFCSSVITTDIRNNSAWNQRWFAFHGKGTTNAFDPAAEVSYAMDVADTDLYNESPLVYVLGVLREQWKAGDPKNVTNAVLDRLLAAKDKNSAHVHSALVEIYIHLNDAESQAKAVELCNELMSTVDVVRLKYWAWKLSTIKTK